MLNTITLMGRLTHDPELRKTPADISVTSFSIACDRDFKNENGEADTDFFDIVAWRKTAEFVANHFEKGKMICIDGRLQQRKYTDKEGNKRYAIEIIADRCYFCGSKNENNTNSGNYGDNGGNNDDFVPDFGGGGVPDEFIPNFNE